MREEKKADKVIAIYRAIEELVAEGADISSVRVSDIALRAGIGKGTAYEYFSSKEEMVVKAMIYLVNSIVKRILNQMEERNTFKDAFVMLFDELEEKSKQRACIMKYLNMLSDMNLCEQMHDVLLKNKEAISYSPISIIRYLIERGQKEGVLSYDYPRSYMETVLFSRVIAFVMYVDEEFENRDYSTLQMKEQLYLGVCRELGVQAL